MLQLSDTQDETTEQTTFGAGEHRPKAMAAGLATAFAGATTSYILLWFIMPILLPISKLGIPNLALLVAAFLGSAFAGIEVMEMLHTSRAVTVSAVTDSVVGGLRVILCLDR
jgi:hypothetical protein